MKIRKGQGVVTIDDLHSVISVAAHVWGDNSIVWPVLRTQAQTVERDPKLRGEGAPNMYVQSGEDLLLFPVPDGSYELEITYHTTPKRV